MNVAPTIGGTPSPGKRRGATCDARRRNGTPKPPSAPTAFPRIPACQPGDMNVAPTIGGTPSPGKRRDATCDARRRNGTSKPPSAPTVFPHNSVCQPDDMNVAPTIEWTPSPGKRRGATCDARTPLATLIRTTRNAAAASCHDGSGLHKWNPCGHRRETADRIYGMADRYFWMADRNGGTAGRENGRPLCRGRRGVGLMSWLSCV